MPKFPTWVEPDNEIMGDQERAHRRLRFLINLAAIYATERASISALAVACGTESAHIHAAMREGHLSPKMAAKIEKLCGREIVQREWLIYPLEIHELVL